MVSGIVGAGGKTYCTPFAFDRDGCKLGSWCSSELHPAGVSPNPWRKTMAAGLLLLGVVDMALICVSFVVAAVMNKRGKIDSFAL